MTSIPMTTEYVDVKVKIGAVEFTNEELQIDSIKISNGCYDGSVFGIGNVYIKNANITMNYRDGITKGLSMEIFFEYQGAWISFGKFVVTETPVMSGDKLSVSLESEFGQTVSTSVDFTSTLQEYTLRDIKTKIEEITGKPIIFVPELTTDEEKSFLEKTACFLKNITDYVNQSGIKTGISVRDMLSGIAILFGGNAYEDTNNKIIIKQKTYYKNSNRYVTSDYLDSNYKYSQEIYAVRLVTLTFLPWCLGLFNPPNASGRICTVNYLGEDKVSNTLLASQSSMDGKTPYDYTIDCDWVGWTSDGSTFDTNVTPGGRASACLRQGDLMYRTCDMTFVGIDFGWNIAPGNLVKVKVPELGNPIDVLCGEISYEWDGGFTTNISCNCNIESNGSYSTQVSTQASAAAAQEGRQTSLELNYANITFSNIDDSTIRGSIFKDGTIDGSKIKDSTITGSLIADSTIKGSNIEEGTITGSKIKAATITGALIVDGTIRGNHIMESSIDGSKIEDSAITESKISNSSITNSKIKDGEIENSKIKDATLTGAKIKDATIGFAKVDSSFIKDLTADKAYIENLKASIADIGYLTANEADIKYATIASLEVVDGKIDNLETIAITTNNLSAKVADLGYLNADKADIAYAKIDFSNVGTQVVSSSMIIDGAVTNEKVANLSANKITSGTIDASKITVTNLNADNITVGTINGQRIGNGSLSLDKLAEEVPTKEYLDNVEKNLQGQIDGAIETFTKSEIPTLNNEPASLWTDNKTRKKHIGDVCYVLNPKSDADGYCYRFANTGTEESPSYEWVLIKDSDVTKALQDIIDINGDINGIKKFDEEISSWKKDTDVELSSLKSRTETLETDIGSKVESSVFNKLKQTVDENSSNITSLSTTVSKKADSSTVETLTNTVNSVKQTADKNTSSISSMSTEIGKKADGSTVTELSQRTSNLEQNLDGFKTTVSKTYTTKTEFDDLSIGGRNLISNIASNWQQGHWDSIHGNYMNYNGRICTKVGLKVSPGETYALKIYLNGVTDKYLLFRTYGSDGSFIGSVIGITNSIYTVPSNVYELRFVLYENVTLDDLTNGAVRVKVEKGNKATDWTPAPEDTEESITEVKTIAEQTADKFSWLVKSGTSATNFELTDRTATLVANHINLNGLVTFSGLNSDAQNKINSAENAVNNLEIGGRNLFSNSGDLSKASFGSHNAGSYIMIAETDGDVPSKNVMKITWESAPSNGGVFLTGNNLFNARIKKGDAVTVSIWCKCSSDKTVGVIDVEFLSIKSSIIPNISTKWQKYIVTGTANKDVIIGNTNIAITFYYGNNMSVGDSLYLSSPKVEFGNKATDWSPAQEDTEKSINNVNAKAQGIIDNIYTSNTTTIDGGKITTGSIKAANIDVDNLFAQDITATGTITGATLVGASVSADRGTIAGFNLNNYGLVKESNQETVKLLSYDNLNGGGLYVTSENSLSCHLNASGIGISYTDNNEYESAFHLSRYMLYFSDKLSEESDWSRPFELSIGQGRDADGNYVHDPYFRVDVPSYFREFECSSLKCTNANFNNSSATINAPTTVNNNLTVTSVLNTSIAEVTAGIEIYHHDSTPYIDFHNSPYGQGSSDYNFRIISTGKNLLDFENNFGSIFKIHDALAYENGYSLIGCTVTKSGNFTCKKYRDGRLIIEFRFKTTSNVSLSNKAETYYVTGSSATFPVAFTDVPSVISGLGIANSQAPFCNVNFDSVTKTGFGRYIIWTLPTISGYVIPSGSVVSATFTGRWK